jgi:predicted HTH transcriptional regulator
LTGDHAIKSNEIETQEEYKLEAALARELQVVPGLVQADLDLSKINNYIYQRNQPVPIETMKSTLEDASSFLERCHFLKDGKVTLLGALVCSSHPGDKLGFKAQVHCYVDFPRSERVGAEKEKSQIVRDKQDIVDNVLQLMEKSYGYLLRNIQVGVSAQEGGMPRAQYPDDLLRETVNNALAHRDYSIDRQAIVVVVPGTHIEIRNPGTFRKQLLLERMDEPISIRRILPEAKAWNPKLADVLRVYRKWEGRGIGMATLVNLCLQNQIDLPYYRLRLDEVALFVCAGKLLDENIQRLFQSFDGFIEDLLHGNTLTKEQQLVLAYLIKSEWANEKNRYTIMLTPDNNHYEALIELEKSTLIRKLHTSTPNYPIYVVHRTLMSRKYTEELRDTFGKAFDDLPTIQKQILGVFYRFHHFNKLKAVSAKQASFALWFETGGNAGGIVEFDSFYRKVRTAFNKLTAAGFIEQQKTKVKGVTRYELKLDTGRKYLI